MIKYCPRYNNDFFVHMGTLLGVIRDKAVFSWTADVDIAMPLDRKHTQ